MAVTQGHGNPDWTKEETVLALALYFELEGKVPDLEHPKVLELSKFLREMLVHSAAAKRESFRNPSGVAFKLQNLRQVATGKGLKNSSKMDAKVWAEFGGNQTALAELARNIRLANKVLGSGPVLGPETDEDEDDEFFEGKTVTKLHKRRERSRGLRKKILANRRRSAPLKCEICAVGPRSTDPHCDDAIFEVHHNISPVAAGERKTKVADVSLLCANCHKHLHRIIRVTGAWIFVADAAASYSK